MKQLYQILPFVLGVGLLGCSNSDGPATQESADADTTPVTANEGEFVSQLPDNAPIVKVASDSDFPPYEFKNEYGNITGFDIDVMNAIGEDQGFRVETYTDLWEVIFDNLDDKNRDMIAAAVPYSAERASKYLLSDPYAPLPSTLVYVDQTLELNSLDDLAEIKIRVLGDTVQEEYFSSGQFKVKSVEAYPTTFGAVQAMAQGKVDAVAEDSGALRYMISELPDLQAQYFDYEDLTAEAARKVLVIDKDQPELLEKVNAGLKTIKENGTYASLTTKWFGKDLTEDVSKQQATQPK